MLTSIWGPSTWHLLHCISFNYPIQPTHQQKQQYMNFVLSLQNVLPCGKCRSNLLDNFRKLPLRMKHMESRTSFSKYIYDLHEVINTMLCKKSNVTYKSVRDMYEHFRARCTEKATTKRTREKGCTRPFHGKKTKCILRIVPSTDRCKTFA